MIERSISFQIRKHWNSQLLLLHELVDKKELTYFLIHKSNHELLNLQSSNQADNQMII